MSKRKITPLPPTPERGNFTTNADFKKAIEDYCKLIQAQTALIEKENQRMLKEIKSREEERNKKFPCFNCKDNKICPFSDSVSPTVNLFTLCPKDVLFHDEVKFAFTELGRRKLMTCHIN